MVANLQTDKRPLTILVNIHTNGKQRIRIIARDLNKPNTIYTDRQCDITGKRTLQVKMPKSPSDTELIVYNMANKAYVGDEDKSFTANIETVELKTCPMWMSQDTLSFVKFAQDFCSRCGILSGDYESNGKVYPSIYASNDNKFHIHLYNKIRDSKGNFVGTPARIGHKSGVMDVSKEDFDKYTVPVRLIILLHEYNHFYGNEKNGMKIENESGADILGLLIYFSLGYSEIEAHQAFLNVFRNANNEGNKKRYLIIKDFIDRYARGEINNNCYFKTNSVTIK